MKQLLPALLLTCFTQSWALQPIQAATVVIMKDPEVTVKIVRNKKNTNRLITIVLNPQDNLIVSTLPPRSATDNSPPPSP